MQWLSFILNVPWTVLGILLALLSFPKRVELRRRPASIIVRVRSFWWYKWLPGKSEIRAITNGHTIQLGPLERDKDLDHELVHVEQAIREPFIHPVLYTIDSIKHGYLDNKYEKEAYSRANNSLGKQISK